MIKSREDLKKYVKADKEALGFTKRFPSIVGNEIWKYEIALRYYEYHTNCITCMGKWFRLFWKFIHHHYGVLLGFDIPVNTCGKGLNIHHWGCIVIHPNARIGDNCNIQQCVNIGQNYGAENVPIIGNNVYLGPGVKIFGKIKVADGCAIGANSVVCKSFVEPNKIIVGNPARVVGDRKPGLE